MREMTRASLMRRAGAALAAATLPPALLGRAAEAVPAPLPAPLPPVQASELTVYGLEAESTAPAQTVALRQAGRIIWQAFVPDGGTLVYHFPPGRELSTHHLEVVTGGSHVRLLTRGALIAIPSR